MRCGLLLDNFQWQGILDLKPPLGIGILSMSFGCFCSLAFTGGEILAALLRPTDVARYDFFSSFTAIFSVSVPPVWAGALIRGSV